MELQVQVKVFQVIVSYLAFHKGYVTERVCQHHVLKLDGFVVDQYGGTEGVERVEIADFAAAIVDVDASVDVRLLQRALDVNRSIAVALKPCNETRDQRREDIQAQRIHGSGEIEVVGVACRIIGTCQVQHTFIFVEHFYIHVNRLFLIVPRALDDDITHRVAIQPKLVDNKVSQHHRRGFQVTQQGIA